MPEQDGDQSIDDAGTDKPSHISGSEELGVSRLVLPVSNLRRRGDSVA
jgi:hypothetical protein